MVRLRLSRELVRGGRVRLRRITQNRARGPYARECVKGKFSESRRQEEGPG
jgi:hypothetical protein